MKRVIIDYNSIHYVTKYTPYAVIKVYINTTYPVDLKDQIIISDYIRHHKETTKQLYDTIKNQNQQTKTILRRTLDR